jgi:hypothetical protein
MKRKQLAEERIAFALRQAESGTAARSAKVLLKSAKASLSSVRMPRRPQIASAGFRFAWKFREQFSLRDTEYAGSSSLLDCKSNPSAANSSLERLAIRFSPLVVLVAQRWKKWE